MMKYLLWLSVVALFVLSERRHRAVMRLLERPDEVEEIAGSDIEEAEDHRLVIWEPLKHSDEEPPWLI